MADGGSKVDDDAARMVARDKILDEQTQALIKRQASGKAAKAMMLPPLLERRRLEHVMPDGAFICQPAFEEVYLWQLAPVDLTKAGTIGEGTIILTDNQREYLKDENPRGVLIAAGLRALDQLRTNGIDLGHIVRFRRYSPAMLVVDTFHGKIQRVLTMYASAISGSEDLEQMRRSGEMTVQWDPEADEGRGQHVWVDKKGHRLVPKATWQPADKE